MKEVQTDELHAYYSEFNRLESQILKISVSSDQAYLLGHPRLNMHQQEQIYKFIYNFIT